MAQDKQQQEEELIILKSILGDTITDLSDENDQFEINVEFQLPSPFYLRLSDGANQLSTLIQHLPPLILTVHFHDQYPSSIHSPTFVLSSCYLSRAHLESMCEKLDKVWEQNISEPIVYQWIECLKEHFLSVDELCLVNDEVGTDNDEPRAMSNYEPRQATRVYEQLIDYNRDKENEQFLLEYHECPICLTNNIIGRRMIRLYKCQHAFCQECLHEYAQMHVNTGSVEWLLCPDSQCHLAMLPSEIKSMLNDDQLYEKYERLLLQKTLEQMLDVVWCPRCQQAVISGNENDNLAICDQCRFPFCKKCKKTYHSETLCGRELELALLQAKHRKLRDTLNGYNLNSETRESLLRELLAVAKIENTARLCPNPRCQVPIEKNEGCNHMFCTRCQTHFNWTEAVDQTAETKVLFERFGNDLDQLRNVVEGSVTTNIDDFDTMANSAIPLLAELVVNRTKKCPNVKCGRTHVKVGNNNYIICEHCKRGYCFSCGKSIKDAKSHFERGCKRYSNVL